MSPWCRSCNRWHRHDPRPPGAGGGPAGRVARVPDRGRVPPAHAAHRASAGRRRDGTRLRVDGGRHGWAANRQGQGRADSLRTRCPVRDRAETIGRASVPIGREYDSHPTGGRQQTQRDGHGQGDSAGRRHREPGGTRPDYALSRRQYEPNANQPMQRPGIRCGRVDNAQKDLGTLESGKLADIVAVAGDPVQHISALRRIAWV
jgi:hypothetical protein